MLGFGALGQYALGEGPLEYPTGEFIYAGTTNISLAAFAAWKSQPKLRSTVNLTLVSTSPKKFQPKIRSTTNLTLAESAAIKFQPKIISTINLVLAESGLAKFIADYSGFTNLTLAVTSPFKVSFVIPASAIGFTLETAFLYNPAFLLGEFVGEIDFTLGDETTYRADFWNPLPVGGSQFEEEMSSSSGWVEDSAQSEIWEEEDAL